MPITILIGEPMHPQRGDDYDAVSADLRERMAALLDQAQRSYPEIPAGRLVAARHLGGTAPTPEEAAEMDEAEAKAREARHTP